LSVDEGLFRQAGALIDRANDVLILSHHRPDGDAIGSMMAVGATLRRRGKRVGAVSLDPIPQRYAGLVGDEPIELWDPAVHAEQADRADAILVLDTASWSQLEAARDPLLRARGRVVVVDHHQTRDEVGGVSLIDATAAATGLLVYEWFRALDWPLPRVALDGLFAALATDTGWFRFSNTDARAMGVAAELIRAGVEGHRLYEAIYWSDSVARVRLQTRALAGLELHAGGRLAVMRLDQACFEACQASPADSEDLINEPMRIGSVHVSVLLIEPPEGDIRVSLRSKGQVDVAALAGALGGGGHTRAAGLRLPGPMVDAHAKILGILREALAADPGGAQVPKRP